MSPNVEVNDNCPAKALLKVLSGKWKPEIFNMASHGPVRFNNLLKILTGSNRQSLTTALRELEESGLLQRIVVQKKPLHVEYTLTSKGKDLLPVFEQLELLA
jgi:DNA-binding HxlR family transcriptional regulator